MKNNIIAVRLTDNWIKNEQIRAALRYALEKIGVEDIDNANLLIHAKQSIPKEIIPKDKDDFWDYIKRHIAVDMGMLLLQRNLIEFETEEDCDVIHITGTLNVVEDKTEKGGEAE